MAVTEPPDRGHGLRDRPRGQITRVIKGTVAEA